MLAWGNWGYIKSCTFIGEIHHYNFDWKICPKHKGSFFTLYCPNIPAWSIFQMARRICCIHHFPVSCELCYCIHRESKRTPSCSNMEEGLGMTIKSLKDYLIHIYSPTIKIVGWIYKVPLRGLLPTWSIDSGRPWSRTAAGRFFPAAHGFKCLGIIFSSPDD